MSKPYNDLKQVEMSVEAAKNMIGAATMSMDPNQLSEAEKALESAKVQLESAKSNQTYVDGDFLQAQASMISKIDEQLKEARR